MAYFQMSNIHLYGSLLLSISILYLYFRYKRSKLYRFCEKTLEDAKVYIVASEIPDNDEIFDLILRHVKETPVLGFDCEWVTNNGRRQPIALLQLATYQNTCIIIRLNTFRSIPEAFKDMLANPEVLKVGVSPQQDGQYLLHDYGLKVLGTIDLRCITRKPNGLGNLSKELLGFTMNKNWRLRCSDWGRDVLTETQIKYAAQDALIAVELFKKLEDCIYTMDIKPYIDRRFSNKVCQGDASERKKLKMTGLKKLNTSTITFRKSPLYNNCYMQAPDGEILCTCDKKKADWYLSKQLANLVQDDPYTIRLRFEPAGRAVGDVGQYYTTVKMNRCVVCGRPDSYIRKNVVPREYRKLFPLVMKEHTSHDVLLLCIDCHQVSNTCDGILRERLAVLCDAPISKGGCKMEDSPSGYVLGSAARTLVKKADQLPPNRKTELEAIVLKYFPGETEVTEALLESAQSVAYSIEKEDYEPHSQKVVHYFVSHCDPEYKNELGTGGLTQLEQEWRQHFLQTMQPRFMPALWSVTHNKRRLELHAEEGRIDAADLRTAGCTTEGAFNEI